MKTIAITLFTISLISCGIIETKDVPNCDSTKVDSVKISPPVIDTIKTVVTVSIDTLKTK